MKTFCLFWFWNIISTMRQNLNNKKHNEWDLESNFFRPVRLWINFFKLSDFELKKFRPIRFWKRNALKISFWVNIFFISLLDEKNTSKISCFDSIYSVKTTNDSCFVLFQNRWSWKTHFDLTFYGKHQFLNKNFSYKIGFWFRKLSTF